MSEKGLKASLCEIEPLYRLPVRHIPVVEAEEEFKEEKFLYGHDHLGKYRKGVYPWDNEWCEWEDYKMSQRPPSDEEENNGEFFDDEVYVPRDDIYDFNPCENWGWGPF